MSGQSFSLGDLRIAAERAIAAGEAAVSVDAAALLALCRSEDAAWRAILRRTTGDELESVARRLAETVARQSILGDPVRHRLYVADCEADGEAYVPLYTEADIAHYIETRWQDFAQLLAK